MKNDSVLDIYKTALKNHTWENSELLFWKWICIEADHKCSPENQSFRELKKKWNGKKEINNIGLASHMQWDEKNYFMESYVNMLVQDQC